MPRIDDLFTPHTARSVGFENYTAGEVAYVTNGLRDNGIVGFVEAKPSDKYSSLSELLFQRFVKQLFRFRNYRKGKRRKWTYCA